MQAPHVRGARAATAYSCRGAGPSNVRASTPALSAFLRVARMRDTIRRPVPWTPGGFMRSQLLLLAAGVAFVAACKSSTSPSGGGHSTTISVENNFFSPTPDTVPAGEGAFHWAAPPQWHKGTWLSRGPTTPSQFPTIQSRTDQAPPLAGGLTP